jgi:hypothetical protein
MEIQEGFITGSVRYLLLENPEYGSYYMELTYLLDPNPAKFQLLYGILAVSHI